MLLWCWHVGERGTMCSFRWNVNYLWNEIQLNIKIHRHIASASAPIVWRNAIFVDYCKSAFRTNGTSSTLCTHRTYQSSRHMNLYLPGSGTTILKLLARHQIFIGPGTSTTICGGGKPHPHPICRGCMSTYNQRGSPFQCIAMPHVELSSIPNMKEGCRNMNS